MEDDIEELCRNVTINREENTVNKKINLLPGLYIIREVAEVESDGQLTIHRKKNVLELRVNELPPSGLLTQVNPYACYNTHIGYFYADSSSDNTCTLSWWCLSFLFFLKNWVF
jgi:hypothetical protein